VNEITEIYGEEFAADLMESAKWTFSLLMILMLS
jgi:hypothetical protein